jgi:hypothetical protein
MLPLSPASVLRSAALACVLFLPALTRAEAPLHERIDQAIESATKDFARLASGPASDGEFLRRITLDLIGTIPTAEQVRAFLKDADPNKREKLIDRLLASPEHARHFAGVLDVWLQERRPDKHVPAAQWQEYLRTSVAANKPWDVLVREILSADGADPKQRAAAKFYLEREAEPNLLVKDVSRLLLGMNLQCAQCHDHPLVEEYKQQYYYGLFAFFNRTYLVPDPKNKLSALGEKADGEATYQSVFDPAKTTKTSLPRVLDNPGIKDRPVEKGKEYLVPPAKGARSVPTYSRRAQLAAEITAPATAAFPRNAANRLWAHMMGRGLVHPLDWDHPANPPSHPELLALLAESLAAMKYDLRAFLRELALSRTYQRSSEPKPGVTQPGGPPRYTVALLKPLSPEQLAWSIMQATGLTDAERAALGPKATADTLAARLAGNVRPFVTAYGNAPGTSPAFDATLDQALFLANGPLVRGWLAPRAGNLADRVAKLPTDDARAEELFLSVFSRPPSADERKDIAAYLASRSADRAKAVEEIVWAMLASVEFRFNH